VDDPGPRPHREDAGPDRGGKRGKHGRDRGPGHKGHGRKGHDKHRCGRHCSHHDHSWHWYWYWGFPSYRYFRYCGLPWYGSWPFYDTYNYSYYYYEPQPSYTDYSSAPYSPTVYTPDPCPATVADAWELLVGGRPDAALEAFDCLAGALPDDGLPLVGHALAASLLVEHDDAITSMREALRVDPESLRYVPDDERLRGRLAELVEHYEYRARHQYGDLDALFMAAALWYLLNQEDAAHYAINVAVTLGDSDSSTLSLKSLIETAHE
jgi:tetratricopeptide (TPR) repeat protein